MGPEKEPANGAADFEDEATLAAIDDGIRDVDAGRAAPLEEARTLLAE